MEVVVRGLHNVDAGSVISIRAGSTRRQGPTPLEKPFRFPNLPLNAQSLKVDIMRPLGSYRIALAPKPEQEYEVKFPTADGADMRMDLLVKEVPSICGVMHPDQEGPAEDPARRASAEDSARSYIERWRLMDFFREMLQYIIREKPQDPYAFMSTYLGRRTRRGRESASGEPSEAEINQDSIRATIARQNARLDAENERLRTEIETLRQFCEEKGLPPVDEPLDLSISAEALGIHQDLGGRNSQLRIEHQELRRTLDSFSRGFQALAGRLNAVVAAAPMLAVQSQAHVAAANPVPYEDVLDTEIQVERENARIARENAEISRQIEELMAAGAEPDRRQSV